MEITPELNFEEVFCSKGRAKIIKVLSKNLELNISEIIKQTHLNHNDVKKHLKFLCQINFIQEKKFGRIYIYRFKDENFKANAITKLILLWENKDAT